MSEKIALPADLMLSVATQIREFLDAQYRQHAHYFQTGSHAYVPGWEMLMPLAPAESRTADQAFADWQTQVQNQYTAWYQLANELEEKALVVKLEEAHLSR